MGLAAGADFTVLISDRSLFYINIKVKSPMEYSMEWFVALKEIHKISVDSMKVFVFPVERVRSPKLAKKRAEKKQKAKYLVEREDLTETSFAIGRKKVPEKLILTFKTREEANLISISIQKAINEALHQRALAKLSTEG